MSKTKTIVVGAGKSGFSIVRFLAHQDSVTLTDESKALDLSEIHELSKLQVEYLPGLQTAEKMKDFDRLILSPGVPLTSPIVQGAIKQGIPVLGEIEFAFLESKKKFSQSKILAITGTNGKSTTTHLLSALINGSSRHGIACGNIGMPFTEALGQARSDTFFVSS